MAWVGCSCIGEHMPGCAGRWDASPAATPQPMPTGDGIEILPLVIADLQARDKTGRVKYGTTLRAGNGRDAAMDAYQEALDEIMYRKQALIDRDAERATHAAVLAERDELRSALAELVSAAKHPGRGSALLHALGVAIDVLEKGPKP